MERAEYVQQRRSKYMAQILEGFERDIEPLLPTGSEDAVSNFKGLVRARVNALAKESVEIMSLEGVHNGVAVALRG